MTVELRGLDAALRRLSDLAEKAPDAVGAGLFLEANNIMADAKTRVPVDQGVLRASGYVAPPVMERGSPVVELGFGGPAASYAVRQHEDTSLRHPDGGEAKFLEKAADQARPGIAGRVAAFARAVLEMPGRGVPTPPTQHQSDPGAGGGAAAGGERKVNTGKRGGRWYHNSKGRKVYLGRGRK